MTTTVSTLDVEALQIVKRQLHQPTLEEVAEVLKAGLRKNFAEVEVEVVDCPDLTREPFNLAAPALNGDPTILEVGSPAFLLPTVQRNKLYDIPQLLKHLHYHSEKAFVIGAGAGPWPYLNCNCELIMNMVVTPSGVNNGTRISSVDPKTGSSVLQTLPARETRFALLGNFYASRGESGKVIKVHVKKRTGSENFVSSMQKELAQNYKNDLVGLGGTFVMNDGKIKQHVMPDFSATPIKTEAQLNEWLRFYNMSTPLVAVGTFVSAETDLDLRVQHFHSFSQHGEGGHYHYDTTPDTIEYLGYFNLGRDIVRVDKPTVAMTFGKD